MPLKAAAQPWSGHGVFYCGRSETDDDGRRIRGAFSLPNLPHIEAIRPIERDRDLPVYPTKPLTKDTATPPESGNRRLYPESSGNYSYPSMRRQALVERSVEIL